MKTRVGLKNFVNDCSLHKTVMHYYAFYGKTFKEIYIIESLFSYNYISAYYRMGRPNLFTLSGSLI